MELSAFIREHQQDILADWERAVRQLPAANELDHLTLVDHIPGLLARIAEMVDEVAAGGRPQPPSDLVEHHALERLDEGFDLARVVTELSVLRDGIFKLAEADAAGIRAINQAIDRAIVTSVQRYTYARDRTLQALDQLFAAALETRNLGDFLERLLAVLLDTTPAIDTATILLRDDGVLRVRASAGYAPQPDLAMRIGDGFAGRIAQTGQPLHLHDAATDPLVLDAGLRTAGVKGLFGVPLLDGERVIGVAHIGSLTAHELSRQDRRLLVAMASRATAAISQHMLRDAAERRAREQTAVAKLGTAALSAPDTAALLELAVRCATDTLGADMTAVFMRDPGGDLVLAAGTGWKPGVVGAMRVRADTATHIGSAYVANRPLAIEDLPDDKLLRDHDLRSIVAVPIPPSTVVSPPYGVLVACSRRPGQLAEADVAFLVACAHVLGTAIALREAEAARALSIANLESVLASSALGIAFLDRDLRYIRINDALAAINGPPASEHLGRTVRDVLGDVTADQLEPSLRHVLATRQPVMNLESAVELPSTPGRIRVFLSNYFPVETDDVELFGVGGVLIEITDRKRTEEALRRSERQLRTLADTSPQRAWSAAADGTVTWFNERWRAFTGQPGVAGVGVDPATFQHPDERERVMVKYQEHIDAGVPWQDVYPLRARNGGYRWFLGRSVPIRDDGGEITQWFGTATDITEQRFMADATAVLSSSLDYKQTLAKIAELAVPALADWCAVDLVEANATTRVAVAHSDPAKVRTAHDLAREYPPDPSSSWGAAHVIRTGEPELVSDIPDEMLVQRTRDAHHLELSRALGFHSYVIVPLVARGRILGAITLVSAESRRRYGDGDLELAVELGQRAGMAVDNARLYEESQRETHMREDILAIVSHDLKNPLGAIHLAAQLLLSELGESAPKQLHMIERASTRMEHLIADLLDMASVQAGRFAVDCKREDVERLMREVFEVHEPFAREKGISLACDCQLRGAQLLCDRERLMQVFGNLIGNALKFCGPGDHVTIRGRPDGAFARFEVDDDGPGIPADELAHVFEPYWSARRTTTKKRGTGLGLFISQGIVQAHGGKLWAESVVGKGTRFSFTVRLA